MSSDPPSYNHIDKFVTRIHEESGKANRRWSSSDRATERDNLVLLKLSGFIVTDADAVSKDFIVGVSRRFPGLTLDADSVRSPICKEGPKYGCDDVHVRLTLMDYERLHKNQWFSDRLMHFWKVWLQHGPTYDRKEIDFYDSLQFEKERLKSPEFDSVRMHLDPFDKKMVLIILNFGGGHWNLVVLLNLHVMRMKPVGQPKSSKSLMPCMLLLDSFRFQKSGRKEHRLILSWLKRKEPTLEVTEAMIPLFVLPVLHQDDCSSCGPLSILNAYCMIRLHKQAFTYEYAGVNLKGEPLLGRGEPFEGMVKHSMEFAYSLYDVDRILGEMRSIINELSTKQRQAA
jgi:hypothetical protein